MQLSRLDRWLRERFIYETHIFTLRLPEQGLPMGVKVCELAQNKGGDYRHRLIIKDNQLAEQVVLLLKQNQIMHAIHVLEGKHWYNKFIAPAGKSFTYMWLTRVLVTNMVCFASLGVHKLWQNESLRSTVEETIEEFQKGL